MDVNDLPNGNQSILTSDEMLVATIWNGRGPQLRLQELAILCHQVLAVWKMLLYPPHGLKKTTIAIFIYLFILPGGRGF